MASVVVRGGTVYDGLGSSGRSADVVIDGDVVALVGDAPQSVDAIEVDATGQAVIPGLVNVLSHAWGVLQQDGSAASDLLQGVTTEVFGEAFTPGPSSPAFVELCSSSYEADGRVDFARLSEGLSYLESLGVAVNVASSLGGHHLRLLAAGFEDRRLTTGELDRLRGLVAEEMQEGALGIGTALIYPPGRFADTDELVQLCEVVAAYDGLYTSHLRSEGDRFLESLDELLEISTRSGVRAEVFHLKAAGRANWPKMAQAIERIDAARAADLAVSANMYPYEAGGTELAASIPPHFHEGGPSALAERLANPSQRALMAAEVRSTSGDFENLFLAAGGGEGILFLDDLADGTRCAGRRLSAVADDLGLDEAAALLVVLSVGVSHVVVNGEVVVRDGAVTATRPGRRLRRGGR